ncbi:uncharacterized protein RSE6_06021 [Rhynchosporium secalis]|uniref:Uncharacterized protein n=1 Tax=Rhynchosporium secalis TaxID=38038 RepID=A0A1E1M9B7_RHYSE|nr:uncharacterized protein RSE6_06021 [Rhynchosporium secalis]
MILVEDKTLGVRVEQWAVVYDSKFAHAGGIKFRSTTVAVIFGTAYATKSLPESTLVASIAFILRAGVKCTTLTKGHPKSQVQHQNASHFQTVEATIDTILYQRLQIALKDLFGMLQPFVFPKAGFLNREQLYHIALVFWHFLRIACLAQVIYQILNRGLIRKVGTISCSSPSIFVSRAQSDAQYLTLKLIPSTHLDLFHSSNPLHLDFSDAKITTM